MLGWLSLLVVSDPLLHLLSKEPYLLFQNWLDPSKEIKKQIRSKWLIVAGDVADGWVRSPGRRGSGCVAPSYPGKWIRTHEFICAAQHTLGKAWHCLRSENLRQAQEK